MTPSSSFKKSFFWFNLILLFFIGVMGVPFNFRSSALNAASQVVGEGTPHFLTKWIASTGPTTGTVEVRGIVDGTETRFNVNYNVNRNRAFVASGSQSIQTFSNQQIGTYSLSNISGYPSNYIFDSTDCDPSSCFLNAGTSVFLRMRFHTAPSTFTLTVTKSGTGIGTVTSRPAGINCGRDCSQSYDNGTFVTLVATPASGSTFAGWSGDSDCSDGSVTMNANKACIATFNVSPQCTLVVSPPSGSVQRGSTFQFNALYDPDGPSGHQGEQNVNSQANWWSDNTSIASHQGGGRFRGENVGSAGVHATYSGCAGRQADASLNVTSTLNNPPVINSCDINPKNGAAPLNTNYTSSVSDPDGDTISIYRWNFGFGNTDRGPSGAFVYTSQGTFTVTLQAQDVRGAWSSQRTCGTVNVGSANQLPVGTHDANDNASCQALGWTTDPDNRNTDLAVKVYSDGTFVRDDVANRFRSDLQGAGVCPGGTCAFVTSLQGRLSPGTHSIEVRAIDAQTGQEQPLGGTPKNISCAAMSVNNNSQCLSLTAPATVTAGQSFNASVAMRNTGTKTWTTDTTPHRLGSQNPQDNTRWRDGRVALPNNVAPNTDVTFNFNNTAPSTPGSYPFDWKMVEDGVEWFGQTCTKTITVNPSGGNITISGRVFNETTGTGFANTTITTCRSSPTTVTTDSNGNFSFPVTPREGFCARVSPEARSGFTGPSLNQNPGLEWAKTYEWQIAGWHCATQGGCNSEQNTWDRASDTGYDFKYTPSGGGCPSGQTRPYSHCQANACVSVDACGASTCLNSSQCVAGTTPTVDLDANGQEGPSISVPFNTAVTLSWSSSNTNYCTASGDWSGSKNTVDIEPVGNLISSKSYTLTCTQSTTGQTVEDNITVNVGGAPVADIKANGSSEPITITYNTAAIISWTSVNASSCSVSPTGWAGTSNTGISTGNLIASQTYTLTCLNSAGASAQDKIIVTIFIPALTVSCTVSPAEAKTGDTVTWSAFPSGGIGSYGYSWSGTDGLSGTTRIVPKIYTTAGIKTGAVEVTSGSQTTQSAECVNSIGGKGVTITKKSPHFEEVIPE